MDKDDDKAGLPSVVSVEPKEFRANVKLNEEQTLAMTLTNRSDSIVAFKIKTTNQERYLVRPTQDLIGPRASKTVAIVIQKMAQYPDASNPKNVRDKFLVQSMVVENPPPELADLAKLWKDKEKVHKQTPSYAEQRIKCKLVIPVKVREEAATAKGQAAEAAILAQLGKSAEAGAGAAGAGGAIPAPTATVPAGSGAGAAPAEQRAAGSMAGPAATAAAGGASGGGSSGNVATAATKPEAPLNDRGSGAVSAAGTRSERVTSGERDNSGSGSRSPQRVGSPRTRREAMQDADLEEQRQALLKEKEREEMMTYVVKLTTENERLKLEVKKQTDRFTHATAANEGLQKRVTELQALLATHDAAEGRTGADDGLRKRGGDAAGGSDAKSAGSGSSSGTGASSSGAVDDRDPGGVNLQLWQLALLFIVFFIVGRIIA